MFMCCDIVILLFCLLAFMVVKCRFRTTKNYCVSCMYQECCCRNVTVCPPAPSPAPPRFNLTVTEYASEWDEYFFRYLTDKALHGLMSELGSPNYWYNMHVAMQTSFVYPIAQPSIHLITQPSIHPPNHSTMLARYRTYPALFNLFDLSSARVSRRAGMFLDLAFLESEQMAVRGFRAGFKMRAKKDGGDYPVYNTTADPMVCMPAMLLIYVYIYIVAIILGSLHLLATLC